MTVAAPLASPTRLSAMACIGRGMASVRANPELVLVTWTQSVLVALLTVAAVAMPLLALGMPALRRAAADPEAFVLELPELVAALPSAAGRLLLALLAVTLLMGLALLVYSWFQAGVFGVLTAAERQAPATLRGSTDDWRLFRTFSAAHLFGWAGRYTWRFFGFYHLLFVIALVPLLATLVWMVMLGLAGERWGGGAATGIGCGGFLPVLFLYAVTGLWWLLGQADLAHDGSGVVAASRRALEVLGGRFGATLVISVLFTLTGLLVVIAFGPVSFAAGLALAGSPTAHGLVTVTLFLLQLLAGAVVTVAFSAALVALVRSERRRTELA